MKIDGAKITAIRKSRGWSREEVAIKAGVTAQAVHSWEQGNVNTFSVLKKVAKALEVPEMDLLLEEKRP